MNEAYTMKKLRFIVLLLCTILTVFGCIYFNFRSDKVSAASASNSTVKDNIKNNSINNEKVKELNLSIGKPVNFEKNTSFKKTSIKFLNKENEIKSKNLALKGLVICIDAGHQAKANMQTEPVAPDSKERKEKTTSGATGIVTKIPEYKLNLEVALMLRDELVPLGAEVIMTRITNDIDISNIERANIANKAKANLFIRIHADSSINNIVNGISLLIPGDKYIKDKKMLSNSKKAGQQILESVIFSTKAKSRGLVIRNDLSGFNWSKVPIKL